MEWGGVLREGGDSEAQWPGDSAERGPRTKPASDVTREHDTLSARANIAQGVSRHMPEQQSACIGMSGGLSVKKHRRYGISF